MKKTILSLLAIIANATLLHAQEVLTLNLSDEPLSYNENLVWDGIYSNSPLQADGLIFSHTAPYGDGYYEGFIASKNTDTQNHLDAAGWTANQWGCMARGGVDPKSNHSFNSKAIEGKPFLINYFSAYSLSTSDYGTSYITTANNATFKPQGIYVCNAPWGYHGCISGDGFASPLVAEGGYYKVTFNGVNIERGTTQQVDFFLAERKYSDRNQDNVIDEADNYTNDHWAWCDLTSLGEVDIIYISMDSSDKGDYGMNTSTLVCLDGMEVVATTAINKIEKPINNIYATNGHIYLDLQDEQEIAIYNASGMSVAHIQAAAGRSMHALQHLPHGIYIVKLNDGCKIISL